MSNKIMDIADLDKKFESMIDKQFSIREKLKPIDRRLKTLDEHIKQAGYHREFSKIYKQYQQEKPKNQERFFETHRRELTLFEAADRYLKGVMNGKTGIPLKSWKAERVKLTADRSMLNQEYISLKDEVKEAEKIRRGVHDIMQREAVERQPHRAREIEL